MPVKTKLQKLKDLEKAAKNDADRLILQKRIELLKMSYVTPSFKFDLQLVKDIKDTLF